MQRFVIIFCLFYLVFWTRASNSGEKRIAEKYSLVPEVLFPIFVVFIGRYFVGQLCCTDYFTVIRFRNDCHGRDSTDKRRRS